MNAEFQLDVFLSHSAKDMAVVRYFHPLSASTGERARVRCRRSQMTKPEEYRFYKGDPNNDIQPVSKEALIGAIKKCHQTLWAGGKFSPPAAF